MLEIAPPEGCPPFSSLPKEAIQLVFELLPSVRSVFNLAFQSKDMLSFVEERVSGAGGISNAKSIICRGVEFISKPILLHNSIFTFRPTSSFDLLSSVTPRREGKRPKKKRRSMSL